MTFHCLRHWVHNYHVDGFRFDLASILSRDREGNLIPNPPVVESIAEDPLLADTKIIAEAWDAAGAYQVGTFGKLRWAEWNGRYRDDVRQFWRGDGRTIGALATRLAGSSALYQPGGRRPYHSINFVTSHDGFTLNDLVSYNQKHNEANGEENRDGDDHNLSFNCGAEGPTTNRTVERLRQRQIKNFLATLLVSQGVPMLLAGDEFRRTQQGNNNAYCQDNAISWLDWELANRNQGLVRFCQALVALRRAEPAVRQLDFLNGRPRRPGGLPDVSWYTPEGKPCDWRLDDRSLVCLLAAVPPGAANGANGGAGANGSHRANGNNGSQKRPSHHVLLLLHAGTEPRRFVLPEPARTLSWRLFLDTAGKSPDDVFPDLDGPAPPPDFALTLEARSMLGYVAKDRE